MIVAHGLIFLQVKVYVLIRCPDFFYPPSGRYEWKKTVPDHSGTALVFSGLSVNSYQ